MLQFAYCPARIVLRKREVKRIRLWPWNTGTIKHKTEIFREIKHTMSVAGLDHFLILPLASNCLR
jgi:hypothetical protein